MLPLLGLLVCGALPGAGPPGADVLVVSLRTSAVSSGNAVRVGDVAGLEGATQAVRQFAARLDLADVPRSGQTVTVTREQLAYRLRLAGLDAARFRMEGAARASVTAGRCQVTGDEIVAAAKQFLVARLPWYPQDVTVELAQPAQPVVEVAGSRDQVRLDPELPSTGNLLGRVAVNVIVTAHGERLRQVPVYFDVKLFQQVAVAVRRIEPGEALGVQNLRFERMAVEGFAAPLTAADDLTGRRAKRALPAGQVIAAADAEVPAAQAPVLVKARELVRVMTRVGPLTLTVLGEAQQDGREGQIIRVRNTDSGRVVQGRVIAPSLVEVEP